MTSYVPPIYQKYFDAGNWKCSKSPRGAHHWLIDGKHGECKHCHEKREFPISPILQGDVHQLDFVPHE